MDLEGLDGDWVDRAPIHLDRGASKRLHTHSLSLMKTSCSPSGVNDALRAFSSNV